MISMVVGLLAAQCPPASGTLTIEPQGGTRNSLGQTLPRVTWSISCPPQSTACPNVPRASLNELRTVFAAEPMSAERVGQGTGFTGETGNGPLPGLSNVVFGANVQFSALVSCNNRGSDVRLTSPAVVFPPTLNEGSRSALQRTGTMVTGVADPDQLVVGQPVFLSAGFDVLPAPSEDVVVRLEGAGVSFSKAYRRPERGGTDSIVKVYRDDPAATLTPTSNGRIAMWLEFAGTRSPEATFTVGAQGVTGGGSGGGSATGGGTGADTGGSPKSGCQAAPLGGLGALAVFGRLLRRARTPRATSANVGRRSHFGWLAVASFASSLMSCGASTFECTVQGVTYTCPDRRAFDQCASGDASSCRSTTAPRDAGPTGGTTCTRRFTCMGSTLNAPCTCDEGPKARTSCCGIANCTPANDCEKVCEWCR